MSRRLPPLPGPSWPTARRGLLPLLFWLLTLGSARVGQAQQLLDFQYVDNLTQTLLDQHRWRALDSVGRAALRLGADYPALRRRLGAAALATDHPAAALRHYGAALHQNPLDGAARAGLAAAYLAFNQPGPAALLARALPDSTRQILRLASAQLITQLELEATSLQPTERRRGAATFGRLGVRSRLSSRLSLTQNLSYYGQQVELPRPGSPGAVEQHRTRQVQYHALLAAQLAPNWQLKAGYDFITKDLGVNNLAYLALAYARPVWTAQAGLYAGTVTDTARAQADLRLTVYPLGNLRLYGFGRGSVVHSSGRSYPNALLGAGGRLRPRLWLEAWGSVGSVPVLAEADGTYLYNLLDPLGRRAAASLLILGPHQLSLRLLYGAEQRRITAIGLDYTLHSFSAALAWTW